jgi:hypothetical protein
MDTACKVNSATVKNRKCLFWQSTDLLDHTITRASLKFNYKLSERKTTQNDDQTCCFSYKTSRENQHIFKIETKTDTSQAHRIKPTISTIHLQQHILKHKQLQNTIKSYQNSKSHLDQKS